MRSTAAPLAGAVGRSWFWEGNVQTEVVKHLEGLGYRIESVANTATKAPGKDVVAIGPAGQTLWVSAKGFSAGTIKTNPTTQARHWFAHALFDLILWHGEDLSACLALAMPKHETYRKLVKRSSWFLSCVGVCIYWVGEDRTVNVEAYGGTE